MKEVNVFDERFDKVELVNEKCIYIYVVDITQKGMRLKGLNELN